MKKSSKSSRKQVSISTKKKNSGAKNFGVDIKKGNFLLVTEPFLFVDRITYRVPGKKVIIETDITGEEWFFKGHFPGNPILPGHILAEAMIQAGTFLFEKRDQSKTVNYLTSTKIRFFKITRPGTTITMTATPVKIISTAAIIHVDAHVDGELISRGDFIVATRDKDKE
ncbi:MAG: 3-hydroxyacyl-ACP dehydratase FabZ family protein [Candidatus Omnitrophota bacterium]